MHSFAVALVALVLISFVAAEPFNCSTTVLDDSARKAYNYSLDSLCHDPQMSDSLFYQDPQSSFAEITYINLCGETTTVCSPSSPVCKRSGLWSTMGFGDLNTQQMVKIEKEGIEPGKGVTVHYSNGEYCPGTGTTSSTIHVVCGTDETITDVKVSADGCILTAVISSKAGCGVEVPYPAADGGEVFAIVVLILLLVGAILYVGIGMIVNWKVKGAQSVPEMIPHREFWMSLPFLVVDGCKFIGHGFKKGDYVSV